MTSPIDSIRRAARLRRAARSPEAEEAEEPFEVERAGLPAVIETPRPAPRTAPPPGAAMFDAQLLGQDGQKRGLRAGPLAIDNASASYNRIEWSGTKDRRARKGRITKTEI